MSGGEAIPGLGSGRIPKGTTRRSSDHLGARAELSPAGFRMSPKGTTSKAKLSPAGLQNGAARNCGAVTNFSEWRRSDSWCIFRMEPPGTAERSEAIPGVFSEWSRQELRSEAKRFLGWVPAGSPKEQRGAPATTWQDPSDTFCLKTEKTFYLCTPNGSVVQWIVYGFPVPRI